MEPEFSEWRWEALDRVSALVVPFKRFVYEHVAREFQAFADV
jgi:putative (di)nucleoside polyphosphate hydrolase